MAGGSSAYNPQAGTRVAAAWQPALLLDGSVVLTLKENLPPFSILAFCEQRGASREHGQHFETPMVRPHQHSHHIQTRTTARRRDFAWLALAENNTHGHHKRAVPRAGLVWRVAARATAHRKATVFEKLNKFEKIVFDVCSVILVVFYSYAAVIKPMATQYHRGVYIIITYVLVFLLYKSKSTIMRVVDYILITLSIACIGYWILMFETINYRTGAETQVDMVFAIFPIRPI